MPKTPDEIKKGLEYSFKSCWTALELGDPLGYPQAVISAYEAMGNALDLIQQLETQNAERAEKIQQLEAERDAAVADIKKMAHDPYEPCFCDYCKLTEEECSQANCRGRNAFEWRGVQKEE